MTPPLKGGFPADQGIHPEVRRNFQLKVHPMCMDTSMRPLVQFRVTYLHPATAPRGAKDFLVMPRGITHRRSFYETDVSGSQPWNEHYHIVGVSSVERVHLYRLLPRLVYRGGAVYTSPTWNVVRRTLRICSSPRLKAGESANPKGCVC